MPNSSGSDFISQYCTVADLRFTAYRMKTQADACVFVRRASPVKAARVVSRAQQLVSDVERSHHGDALGARYPARALYLGHFSVEKGYRGEQSLALLLGARDPVASSHDGDIKGLGFRAHPLSAIRGFA